MNTKFLGSVVGALEDKFEKYRGVEGIDSREIFKQIEDTTNSFIQFYGDNGTVTEEDCLYVVGAMQYLAGQIVETKNIWGGIEKTKEKYELKLSDLFEVTMVDTTTGKIKKVELDDNEE